MRIIFEYEGEGTKKVDITTDAESIYDVMDEIESALVAYGYHPDIVKDGFVAKCAEIEGAE